ncbi:Tox regulatory factor [Actinobaculum suis]|uniref:Tox regulatory factor n=1 Tax=Actinobaculum suis TaxID=1657 RepID=A0A7Z8Y8A5_9ACTO|nr:Tox regulatory factor [Actinobaculum suis]
MSSRPEGEGLVDTREMYLKCIYELEEEGIVPIRARLVERLNQSKPTVSETTARLERDGFLVVDKQRVIRLTARGRARATSVMRKHRLAERLLVDVIGLPWEHVHLEACRWEHVMSEELEARIAQIVKDASRDPFGNPIPAADVLGPGENAARPAGLVSVEKYLADRRAAQAANQSSGASEGGKTPARGPADRSETSVGAGQAAKAPHPDSTVSTDSTASTECAQSDTVTLARIGETLQTEPEVLLALREAGVMPGQQIRIIDAATAAECAHCGEQSTAPQASAGVTEAAGADGHVIAQSAKGSLELTEWMQKHLQLQV